MAELEQVEASSHIELPETPPTPSSTFLPSRRGTDTLVGKSCAITSIENTLRQFHGQRLSAGGVLSALYA